MKKYLIDWQYSSSQEYSTWVLFLEIVVVFLSLNIVAVFIALCCFLWLNIIVSVVFGV